MKEPVFVRRFASVFFALAFIFNGLGQALAQDAILGALPSYIQLAEGEKLADKQEITLGVNRNFVNGPEDF